MMKIQSLIRAAGAAATVATIAAGLGGYSQFARAQTDENWMNAVSGNWSDASKWSGAAVPNNFGANTFNAGILVAGAYTVTLDINATIENFTHTGTGAVFELGNNFNLRVNQNVTLDAEFNGRRDLGGVGTLVVDGNLNFSNGRLRHTTSARVNGDMNFNSATQDEICDTGVDHRGAQLNWNGTGNIVMGRAATITTSTTTTFNINTSGATFGYNGMGAHGTVINNGIILKTSAGQTFFDQAAINNTSTGQVRVSNGTLKANEVNNLSAGTLTGGRWRVDSGATLSFVDLADTTAAITTNAADVTLDSAGSTFASINSVATNAATGKLTFSNGRNFTTAGSFTNTGTLNVGVAGDANQTSFDVVAGSTLTNYSAGTQALTGGTFNLVGKLRFDAADVRNIASTVVLDGANSGIEATGGANALASTLTVAATGDLSVKNRTFTTGSDLTNNGSLHVGAGATVAVGGGGTLTNLTAGVLGGGTYDVTGTLKLGNQSINTINAAVKLDGNAAQIQTAAAADALLNWNTIGAAGDVTLKGAATFTTKANSNFTVATTGKLNVEAGSEFIIKLGTNLTNFSGGIITGGTFNVLGKLRFQNAAVTRIANDFTLGGTGSFVDFADNNALSGLNQIDSTGRFAVQDRTFTLGGNLTLDGRLVVKNTGLSRDATEVIVSGDCDQLGVLELDRGTFTVLGNYFNSGSVEGSGTLNGNVVNNGALRPGGTSSGALFINGNITWNSGSSLLLDLAGPSLAGTTYDQLSLAGDMIFSGDSAGTLTVNADTFAGNVGDVFQDVITFNSWAAGSDFAAYNLTLGDSGLGLRAIFGQRSLSFEVIAVPAPASLAVLGLAAFGLRRRRS